MTFDTKEIAIRANELTGTRRKIYQWFLDHPVSEFGIREISRKLELSSVSLAKYHLDILTEKELLQKTGTNKYRLTTAIPIENLEAYWIVKGKFIPKELTYITFTTAILITAFILFFIKAFGAFIFILLISAVINTIWGWIKYIKLTKET